jgi:hypothetical protein
MNNIRRKPHMIPNNVKDIGRKPHRIMTNVKDIRHNPVGLSPMSKTLTAIRSDSDQCQRH